MSSISYFDPAKKDQNRRDLIEYFLIVSKLNKVLKSGRIAQ